MEETVDTACCESTEEQLKNLHPMRRRRKTGKIALFNIKDPIPEEIADSDELRLLFQRWELVPYAGSTINSGHSLLIWYLALAKLSSTHGTCVSKLNKYAFGSRASFLWSEDPEYDTGEDLKAMTPESAKVFETALKQYVEFQGGARGFHRRLGWSLKHTGNAWAELVIANTQGEISCSLKYQKPTRCLYKNTKPGEAKYVGVSPMWTADYLERKGGPRWVPLYPNFVEMEDGTLHSMFHLKHGDNDWYGRPDTDFADYAKAQEAQHAMYLYKQANANFMGQLIIEVEDDDADDSEAFDDNEARENGFDSFADQFEHNYSMKSDDPQAVLLSSRPFGSRPMFVFQVKPNTNEAWYKVIGEMEQGVIMRANGCTLRFMGFEATNGFSTEVFVDDYTFNQEPVIDEHRRDVCIFTNRILTAIWEHLGLRNFNGVELNKMSLTFSSPIKQKLEDYKTRLQNDAANNNSLGGNTVQPGGKGLPNNPRL